MKLAHVTATFPPYEGGTGNVCYNNVVQLARRGHEVTVFTAAYPPDDYEYPKGITVRRLPFAFRFGNAPFLPGLLGVKHFDIIHLHHPFIFGAELIWATSKLRRIPYVITHHNDLIGNGHRRRLFDAYSALSTRLVVAGAAKFAVVSMDHAAGCRLTPIFRRRWQDVVEVPNGVDVQIFRPNLDGNSVRARYGIPYGAGLILFVGALDRAHHFKGVERLIYAFSRIDDPVAYLMVVGEGNLRSTFARLAQKQGVAKRVVFTGYISNQQLPPYYCAADLVVLPSFPPESFGLVIIEAMACGRPAVAYDIPGVRSVISDGEDGLLVKPGDIESLADEIRKLLSNPGLRLAMGECGRAKVKEQYTWERSAERLEELYYQVLASASASSTSWEDNP